jgi:hypothetical protein
LIGTGVERAEVAGAGEMEGLGMQTGRRAKRTKENV